MRCGPPMPALARAGSGVGYFLRKRGKLGLEGVCKVFLGQDDRFIKADSSNVESYGQSRRHITCHVIQSFAFLQRIFPSPDLPFILYRDRSPVPLIP